MASFDLTVPPAPLTPRQRTVWWVVAVICAISRPFAMAKSLWEWDEALFCLGMRAYDVSSHHPHPPGFPVYIALGRIVRLFIHSDFRALQTINLVAALLVFPAVFMLTRELRLGFTTATIAGALTAFFPNVWFFGGTAFSDVPSIVLVVFAVAFLLRGCRDAEAYLTGAFLLALAAGIRPQNMLVGLVPGVIATWYRARQSWRDVAFAALIGVAVVGVAFGGAMAATGSFDRYMSAIRDHSEYITRIDSFHSPDRPPLWRLFDRFFVKQYQSNVLGIITTIFVVISMVTAIRNRDRRLLINFLTWGPFAVLAWLMLDRFSISRFSIGYCPMFAIFAADGIVRVARDRERVAAAIAGALAIAFAAFTIPALGPIRDDSPSVKGVQAVLQHVNPKTDDLFVGVAMGPFMEYLAPDRPFIRVQDERALPLSIGTRRPWLLAEIDMTRPEGYVFRRAHERLWSIARRHYFDVALEPIAPRAQFVSGWYQPERNGTDEWRWMSAHSVTVLPPAGGDTVLRLKYAITAENVPNHPVVTIAFNGKVLDRVVVTQEEIEHDYHLKLRPSSAPNTLEMSISRTYNPMREHTGSDPRDLGIALKWLGIGPE